MQRALVTACAATVISIVCLHGAVTAGAEATITIEVPRQPPSSPDVTTDVTGAKLSGTSTDDQRRAAARRGDGESSTDRSGTRRQAAHRPTSRTDTAMDQCLAEARRNEAAGVMVGDICTGLPHGVPPRDTVIRPSQDQITATVVRGETKHLPFPALRVQIEPSGQTLVNLETNVYTRATTFVRSVKVLSWPVKIRATPTSYTWNFGDGTTETTDSPGAPYPDTLVTHIYKDRHAEDGGLRVNVTANYDTWYEVPNRPWQNAGTVSIPGPATPLLVCEARPVLTDPDNPAQPTPPPDPANPCSE